jgi:hypothetical protein
LPKLTLAGIHPYPVHHSVGEAGKFRAFVSDSLRRPPEGSTTASALPGVKKVRFPSPLTDSD